MTLRVNGDIITQKAIEYELARLLKFYSAHLSEAEIRSQIETLKQKAKDQAIGAKLLLDEAHKLDLSIPAEEVDKRLDAMVETVGGRDKFEAILRKQNLTEPMVRQSIEEGLRVDALVQKVTADAPDPTEAEMKAHYESCMHEYQVPEQALVQHILIKPASDQPSDQAAARAKLEEVRARIAGGAPFADEAAAHSECPSGRKTGGSLGWIAQGTMVPDFDQAIFALQKDELSEIVETSLGLHILKRVDSDPGGPAEFAQVQDKIRDFLRHARRGELLAAHVKELRASATIEET
jgi:parvulin-like peptidyl-prolyl isomerase